MDQTYAPASLPDNGMAELTAAEHRKTSYPAVALTVDGPRVVYYLASFREMNPDTTVIWSWPGRWRNDVFTTTAGEIVAYMDS